MPISEKNTLTTRKPFTIPEKSSELAEFCGIMLGDGGISTYQASITLHSVDDAEYTVFVSELIEKLFGVRTGLYIRKDAQATALIISRIGIVEFLTQECGLILGNKIVGKADIPEWIKSDTEFQIACVRGLIDTDGSIFTHRYISKEKLYSYKKLSFTSVSEPLLDSVHEILDGIGLHVRFGSNHDVRLDSKSDMKRYFQVIGTHNPKHLKRYAS